MQIREHALATPDKPAVILYPSGTVVTFGEMEASEKHGWEAGRGDLGLSHRARAFALFARAKLGAQ